MGAGHSENVQTAHPEDNAIHTAGFLSAGTAMTNTGPRGCHGRSSECDRDIRPHTKAHLVRTEGTAAMHSVSCTTRAAPFLGRWKVTQGQVTLGRSSGSRPLHRRGHCCRDTHRQTAREPREKGRQRFGEKIHTRPAATVRARRAGAAAPPIGVPGCPFFLPLL